MQNLTEIKHFPIMDINKDNSYCRWIAEVFGIRDYNGVKYIMAQNKFTYVLLVVDNDIGASIIYYTISDDYWVVELVTTSENHRSKGYSRKLFDWLINNSDKPLKLFVIPDNTIAKKFYISLGFKDSTGNDKYNMILDK